MKFYKEPKTDDGKRYAMYMDNKRDSHYVCDMIDDDGEEAAATNDRGLTLRVRLTRSSGAYAMLEGNIFDPKRLLKAVCEVTDYKTEKFTGGAYREGYTLLTITADGCTNKYLVFSWRVLDDLIESIKLLMKTK